MVSAVAGCLASCDVINFCNHHLAEETALDNNIGENTGHAL